MQLFDFAASVTAFRAPRPVRLRRGRARAAAALVVVLLAGAGAAAPAEAQPHPGRVVAVGDIHGAGDELKTILRRTGLIDLADRWSGGTATLVQTGDVTDRGPQVREVMDFLMRLEDDARDAGGEVRVLLGNHETMNLLGDLRDVTPAIFASFASGDAERRREDAYRQYLDHASRRRAGADASGHPEPVSRSAWMETHPPGFVEYMEAMGPDGRYGRWLRGKPVATVVGDTLFVHGGLSPDLPAESVDELNDTARGEIETFDRHRRHLVDAGLILPFSTLQEMFAAVTVELRVWIERLSPDRPGTRRRSVTRRERALLDVLTGLQTINDWSIVHGDGPLWFRGLALRPEPEVAGFIGDVLSRFGVARAVVGHSVTASRRITGRAAGRVFLIDTGMLHGAYRGRPSALELLDGRVTAIYPDERVLLYPEGPVLLDAPAPRR